MGENILFGRRRILIRANKLIEDPLQEEQAWKAKGGTVTRTIHHTCWRMNGLLNRDGDRPAAEFVYGCKRWYVNDALHRDGDKPAWISETEQEWYQHGLLHRDNGPAAIWDDGTRMWFQNGKRHRVDGPAVVHPDGKQELWLFDEKVEV